LLDISFRPHFYLILSPERKPTKAYKNKKYNYYKRLKAFLMLVVGFSEIKPYPYAGRNLYCKLLSKAKVI
jgi:hypothetical protein